MSCSRHPVPLKSYSMSGKFCVKLSLNLNPSLARVTEDFGYAIGNNGAVHFTAYPEPHNHAHSLPVYFSGNLGTHSISWHNSTRRLHYFLNGNNSCLE